MLLTVIWLVPSASFAFEIVVVSSIGSKAEWFFWPISSLFQKNLIAFVPVPRDILLLVSVRFSDAKVAMLSTVKLCVYVFQVLNLDVNPCSSENSDLYKLLGGIGGRKEFNDVFS